MGGAEDNKLEGKKAQGGERNRNSSWPKSILIKKGLPYPRRNENWGCMTGNTSEGISSSNTNQHSMEKDITQGKGNQKEAFLRP